MGKATSGGNIDTILAKRSNVLRKLIKQSRSKSTLEDEVTCSRSTLDRAISELADVNLVAYENGVWKATLLGRQSLESRDDHIEYLNTLSSSESVINELSESSPVNEAFLTNAEVHEASLSVPDAIVNTFSNWLDQSTSIRLATPVLLTVLSETLYDQLVDDQISSLEMVLSPGILDHPQNGFQENINQNNYDPDIELYSASIPFDYGLWIADSRKAGIIVFAEQGIRGLLINDTEESLTWAKHQYTRLRDDATKVTFAGSSLGPQASEGSVKQSDGNFHESKVSHE